MPTAKGCAPTFSPSDAAAGGGSMIGITIWRFPHPYPEENALAVSLPPLLPPPPFVRPQPRPLPQFLCYTTMSREELSVPTLLTLDVEPLRVPSEPFRWPHKPLRLPSVPPAAGLAVLLNAEPWRVSSVLPATCAARSAGSWRYLQRFTLQ